MIIVGELINASRKAIGAAIEAGDKAAIQKVAADEHAAGADYIDVNAGIFVGKEAEYLKWLTQSVQAVIDGPCALDSADPAALEAALGVHRGTAMINSISLETTRLEKLLPIVAGTDLKVVALCMSDRGMPETVDERLAIADRLVNALLQKGVAPGNIYVDPLVQPISIDNRSGLTFLDAIEKIRETLQGVHTLCGLSNISYGLPDRALLNRTFMAMAIAKGLDGAIIDPLDRRMMAAIHAAEALAGRDSYCLNYIEACREKKEEV